MSCIPFGGWKIVPNYELALKHHDYYWGMGLTAEAVATEYSISREDQDELAYRSHQRKLSAIDRGCFRDEIVPVNGHEAYVDEKMRQKSREFVADPEEVAHRDTTQETIDKMKHV